MGRAVRPRKMEENTYSEGKEINGGAKKKKKFPQVAPLASKHNMILCCADDNPSLYNDKSTLRMESKNRSSYWTVAPADLNSPKTQ